MNESIQILDQTGSWRARNVSYWRGRWDKIQEIIPKFTIEDFQSSSNCPANPYLKTIVRQPTKPIEMPIPVGVVSNSYMLVQHANVVEKCLDGINSQQIDGRYLDCELGLTDLGEWMNLRVYFPEEYDRTFADGHNLQLRLECMNSVDGSSRLVILLGWFRLVCSNGLVIGETKKEIRAIHNENLDLEEIPKAIREAMNMVENDVGRLKGWEAQEFSEDQLKKWVNNPLTKKWGKKAACRVFHICTSGFDVGFPDPFASGDATEKPINQLDRVPGSPEKAANLYDVSQAMSWVATKRNNTEERLDWQSSISEIISKFATV